MQGLAPKPPFSARIDRRKSFLINTLKTEMTREGEVADRKQAGFAGIQWSCAKV
jgi:hypothetical protein